MSKEVVYDPVVTPKQDGEVVSQDYQEQDASDSSDLSRFKLILAALPWIGVQALWATEFAITTEYLKDLGLSDSLSAGIWVFGPICGFFTAPIVGAASDRCTSKLGRRRPYIIGGLVFLWIVSLLFASSRHVFGVPTGKSNSATAFAFIMFVLLDIAVNVIQTPLRAIVSDLAPEDEQGFAQQMSVMFQGVGNFAGFGIMKVVAQIAKGNDPTASVAPQDHPFSVICIVLSLLTVMVVVQFFVCKEKKYVLREQDQHQSAFGPVILAMKSIRYMSRDFMIICFVQFWSWYTLFSYFPTQNSWFIGDVYDVPKGDEKSQLSQDASNAFVNAGLYQAMVQILFSIGLPFLDGFVRAKLNYVGGLAIGGLLLILTKVTASHTGASIIVALIAIPVSVINAYPFAFVGLMNKSNDGGQDTGVQMGLLNIFICVPQMVATGIVAVFATMGHGLSWALFAAGFSWLIAAGGAYLINDSISTTKSKAGEA